MSNNRAGAVIHRAKKIEDALDRKIDLERCGKCYHFGGNGTERKEPKTLIEALEQIGKVYMHTHPKTRQNW